MKKWLSLMLVLSSIFSGFQLASASSPTGAAIFNYNSGTRQLGMADAGVGMIHDSTSIYYNPAALSLVQNREINTMYFDDLIDTMSESLTLALPLNTGLLGQQAGLGVGLKAYQGGTILYTHYNETSGTITSQKNIQSENDYLLTIGYGEEVAKGLFTGLAVKGVYSILAEDYTAWAIAADFGLFYQTPFPGWSVGVSLLNLGTPMTYIETAEILPMRAVAGIGFSFNPQKDITINLASDYRYDFDQKGRASFGVEGLFMGILFLRCGHYINTDTSGFTLGAGMKWDFLQLDYGLGFMGELHYLQKIALTVSFQ